MIKINSPYKVIDIKFQRNYLGYLYRRELIDDSEYGGTGVEMVNCYSMESGSWIGNAKDARFLCKKKGLRNLQKIKPEHCVCSLGWNESEQKWYGWSHRAIYGFGVGSKVKKGDCGYRAIDKEYGKGEWVAKTLEDAKQMAIDFSEGVS